MEFTIQTFGQSTFTLSGGPVPVTNAGTKVLNGPAKVSLIFPNLVASGFARRMLARLSPGIHWYA